MGPAADPLPHTNQDARLIAEQEITQSSKERFHQRHLAPSCGGARLPRTFSTARMISGKLDQGPGVREQHGSSAALASTSAARPEDCCRLAGNGPSRQGRGALAKRDAPIVGTALPEEHSTLQGGSVQPTPAPLGAEVEARRARAL